MKLDEMVVIPNHMEIPNYKETKIPVAKILWWEGRPETLIVMKYVDGDETWYELEGSRSEFGGVADEFQSMDDALSNFINEYGSEVKDLIFRPGYEKYGSLLDSTGGIV